MGREISLQSKYFARVFFPFLMLKEFKKNIGKQSCYLHKYCYILNDCRKCYFSFSTINHLSVCLPKRTKLSLLPKFLSGYESGLLPKTQDTKFIQVTAVFSASSVNTQWYFLLQYGVSITYCT